MELLDSKTDLALLRSILGELAKCTNEIRCAKNDLAKATSRLNFLLVCTNKLIERQKED
jgi:hypothetical protein